MHRAVLSGLTDMVDLLVKHKAVVEVANPLDGWTPFHTAVSTGNIAMIKHLLRLKANPKALTTSGLSSLHIAVSHDHAQVVPLLVSSFECDVPVNGRAEFERKFTALHFACQSCHLASLRALLDSKASIDEVDSAGVTPLGMLCRRSESHPQLEECGKLLLANHASPTVTTALGNTPLHLAAMANNVIMCHLLALSNKELMSAKNGEGKTPLQVAQREAQLGLQKDHISDLPDNTRKLLDACRQNDVAKLRDAISKGGDANADDGSGNTALYYAILNKSVEGAVALLQAGALVDKQNERGSPLHVAVMTGIVPLVTALLDKKADAHAADPQWGMRAIHTAAFFGKPEVIRLLIARRCSGANESSEGGKRPLHWAAQRGQLESLNVLLEMGADKEALTDDGLTPLHVAAAHGRAAIVTRLLEAGANPRVLASDQRTVLHFAAQEGDGATIGALVKAVPELVMAKTVGNDTMLHRLCLGGSVGALAHLQGHGPELMSCVNEFGQTPLHLACRHASVQFVTVLLALHENVNVNAEDKDGVMPIYYASAAHKEDVIQLLKSKGAYFREEKIVSDAIRFEPSTSFPKIESASIDALIDYLILTCDKIDDTVFRENFFLAYRQLIKPAELLQKLIQYCKNATPEEEANSFVPNMRVSTQVPMPAVARAPVDSKLARRRSLTGREKKVGLRSSLTQIPQLSSSPPPAESAIAQPLPPVAAPVAAPYVLLPQNPLRRSVVIRVIRRWVMHSPMDFDSRAAGVGKVKRELSRTRSLNKTFTNSRHQMVKEGTFILPRSFPMLRGTMPEENASMLDQFVLSIDPKDDNELMAELTLLDKALCPPDEEVHERPPGAALSLTTSTSSTPTFAPSPMTQKLVGRIGRPSLVEANKPKSSFLDWSAEAAAQQLTFMSKRLWDALSLWEFYDVAFTRKEKDELCPNINALIRHINRVGDWAKSLVLSSDDAKKRGAAISFIIAVMDACLRMRNFSDVMGLSTALQSTSLERLAKSWRFVTEESNTLLKQVKDAMDPRGNYKNLRKLMEEKSGEPTILFVGLTMG
jgi:ankyrin repeat protein